MIRSEVVGIGAYVPPRVVTNQDLASLMETSDEWITQRTGIKERHWSEPGVAASDLALNAATRALDNAGLKKEELDLIVFATLSPDHVFPGSGCFLQAKLGINEIPTIDIRQQCTGFIYGTSIADQFIKSGMYKNVLVVGAENHSCGLDKSTRGRDVSVLFGDGAGAVVLQAKQVFDPKNDSYLYSTHLHADGSQAKELWVQAPGSGMPEGDWLNSNHMAEGLHFPRMNGKKIFTSAVKRMTEVIGEALQKNQMPLEAVDLFLFHQANLRINEAVADLLKIPREKIFNTIDRFGNTTAATIPLGMDEALKAGVLKKGMVVATAAFGSGFTWASSLMRY